MVGFVGYERERNVLFNDALNTFYLRLYAPLPCRMWSPDVHNKSGKRCSSVVRAFAHGAMGRRIDPSWGEPTELFLVPASAP